MTHKQELNKRFGYPINQAHSIKQLSKISTIPVSILKKVYDRGKGAWKTNIRSVRQKGTFIKNLNLPRSQKLTAEQWAMARVYAFVNKLFSSKHKLNHDIDLAKKIPNIIFI